MKHTALLLATALFALLLASCEKKPAPQAQPPSQADTPAPAEVAEPAASASRFYEDGRVRDTMYIDSPEGLRVRGEPSLSAEKRCAVPHRLPVKVVALGAEATIDGITAPWVEILIPRYEWQGEEPEYGWVFGGYLSEEPPEFVAPRNAEELASYLQFLLVALPTRFFPQKEYPLNSITQAYFLFKRDGTFTSFIDATYGDIYPFYHGNYRCLSKECVLLEFGDKSVELTFTDVDNIRFNVSLNSNGKSESFRTLYGGVVSDELFYHQIYSYREDDFIYFPEFCNVSEYIELGIRCGASAKGTEYEQQYHDYWNPIMAEHQRRADTAQPAEDPAPALPAAYGEKSRPTDALDIVFADGTATAWREGLTLTQAQKEAAVAVIFYRGTECSNDGRERLLGVGLAHQKDGLAWCAEGANAYDMNIDTIQCPASGEAGNLTFEGDLDGSDNLSQIGAYLAAHGSEDDTADAQKYPAFYYAKNYAAQPGSRVAGTPFADGWYLPTLAELFQIWKNRKGVDAASDLCGGSKFDSSWYWSSSQYAPDDDGAYLLYFYYGDYGIDPKYYLGDIAVCAVRDFTERTDLSGGTPAPAQTAQPQTAASAGGYAYSGSDDIDSVAWYYKNTGGTTREVMAKAPNALGLYDMSGNVEEWCWDWYDGEYYAKSPAENPRGADSGETRVLRGGCWCKSEYTCRVAFRISEYPSESYSTLGFRVVRSAKESQPAPSGFALVEGGSFRMGSEDGTGDDDEHPAHTVSVDGFYMATHEVTQEEYERVTGENPSQSARGGSYPVESVSWYDAVFYCNARSKQEGLEPCYYVLDGDKGYKRELPDTWQSFEFDSGECPEIHCDWSANGYRLPTEAEWEYAARGGGAQNNPRNSPTNAQICAIILLGGAKCQTRLSM